PAVWEESVYQGRPYGIPVSVDNRALLYNADLLIRAGYVDADGRARPPRTWEELLEYCARLCEFDSAGRMTRAAFVPDFAQSWLYQYGWANGGEFISPDGRQILLNSPEVVEALQFMVKLAEAQGGYQRLAAFKASFQGDSQDPFFTGKLVMKLDGVWSLANVSLYARNLNFAAAPFPRPARFVNAGAPPLSFCGGWAYAIPSSARNKQAAWEFIRFMTSEQAFRIQIESDRARYEAEGRPFLPHQQPLRQLNEEVFQRYVAGNPSLPPRFAQAMKVYNDLLPVSRFRPVTPVGQLLWNEQVSAMQAALYGALTPKQALDRGTANCQRALDRFLAPPQGVPITSWGWFFLLYGVLLAVGATCAVAFHLRRHPRGALTRRQWPGGVLAALPWLAGFVVFGGGPMLFSFVMSFCDYDVLNPPRFVGLKNFRLMATDDPLMPRALWNTVYMLVAVPLTMAVSLAIALLLNRAMRLMALWRTLFYLPAIVPMVAAAVLWVWVLNPQGGLINLALAAVGIEGPQWLQSPLWSKPALILMKLWAAGG
ncbi:MAG: extracellular solute-binding protein, partial [Phycisphaerae bacterium]|nr:extracellular solute-binding protein [Phycisphaerae bacterium]